VTTATLEQRLARLEAGEDIRVVISRFARAADDNCNPERMRPLFTEDAVFEVGTFDTYRGQPEILRKLSENNKTGFHWTLHYLIGPEVAVSADAQTATAFFYLWEPASTPLPDGTDRAYWIGGWYDAELLRGDDTGWRFHRLRLTLKLLSRYDEGWRPMPTGFADV
jgi:hypothetical protein